MQIKLMSFTMLSGSPRMVTASTNCMLGAMNCMNPRVESGTDRAAWPKHNSGTVVIRPLASNSPNVVQSVDSIVRLLVDPRYARYANAGGVNSIVSIDKPT